jgi:Uncharacterised protein conserved in bacteria (DUF2336)
VKSSHRNPSIFGENKMWASIGALVQNGQGNRAAVTLNAIGVLYGHCKEQTEVNMDRAFDAVIAQIVPDLDQSTIETLSLSCPDFAAQFPQFAAIIQEYMERKSRAAPEAIVLLEESSDSIDLTPDHPVERRASPRDPISDDNNPITLARKASVSELLQIAGLPNLPEALTNVLISRGDRMVIERALKNPTAIFAKSSLTTLAELAPSDRMIKEALVGRSDLPEAIAERILPYLNLRAKAVVLLSGAPFNQHDCDTAMQEAVQELAMSTDQGQVMIGLDHCLATIGEGHSNVSDVISILARDARVAELSAFAAQQIGIGQLAAFNALSGRFDHAAGIILRALDCSAMSFDDAMNMRRRCGCREAKETKGAWMRSQRYSVEEARKLAHEFDAVLTDLPRDASATVTEDQFEAIAA